MGNSVSGRSVCPIEGDSISYFEINEEQRAKNMLPSCFREAVWLELGMVGVMGTVWGMMAMVETKSHANGSEAEAEYNVSMQYR